MTSLLQLPVPAAQIGQRQILVAAVRADEGRRQLGDLGGCGCRSELSNREGSDGKGNRAREKKSVFLSDPPAPVRNVYLRFTNPVIPLRYLGALIFSYRGFSSSIRASTSWHSRLKTAFCSLPFSS